MDVHDSNRSFHGLSTGKLLPVFLKKKMRMDPICFHQVSKQDLKAV